MEKTKVMLDPGQLELNGELNGRVLVREQTGEPVVGLQTLSHKGHAKAMNVSNIVLNNKVGKHDQTTVLVGGYQRGQIVPFGPAKNAW